ncbi:hypothetical protein Ais01nite_01120 [Asanoa ishikariensis]|nr:hypothetical protein Ais01nite_01120 [Asanoa ishikariensis]
METPRTAELLAAYFDLRSDRGPLHARVLCVMGRNLLRGQPIPACQSVTHSTLRYSIRMDAPHLPLIDDPRALPPHDRSPEWAHLCGLTDNWEALPVGDRLRVARVLHKLGFWATLLKLPATGDEERDRHHQRALTRLRHIAEAKLQGDDSGVVPPEMYDDYAATASDEDAPREERVSAAVNLAVQHGRSDRDPKKVAHWAGAAQDLLVHAPPGSLSLRLASAAWRAISFMPFYQGDHTATAAMLDEAERLAVAAVDRATDDDRVIAVENLRVLYGTRGAAAAVAGDSAAVAGDSAAATAFYRRAVDLDAEDPQTHVTLGDHLVRTGDLEAAHDAFAIAAQLGAPCTRYARERTG